MPKITDLTGKVFTRLTVVRLTGESRGGSKIWECKCSCGNTCYVTTRHLNRKKHVVKSCGCLKKEIDSQKGEAHRDWKGYGGISQLFWNANVVRSARGQKGTARGAVALEINKQDIWELFLKQEGKCALSGVEIFLPTTYKDSLYTASLDRIDSAKGYVPGNVQWVHKHINLMKNRLSQDYFIELCKHVALNSSVSH